MEESLFCKIAIAGSRRSSNLSVLLLEEFDLDLTSGFFLVWLFEYLFLTASVSSPNSGRREINVGEGGADGHVDFVAVF